MSEIYAEFLYCVVVDGSINDREVKLERVCIIMCMERIANEVEKGHKHDEALVQLREMLIIFLRTTNLLLVMFSFSSKNN